MLIIFSAITTSCPLLQYCLKAQQDQVREEKKKNTTSAQTDRTSWNYSSLRPRKLEIVQLLVYPREFLSADFFHA